MIIEGNYAEHEAAIDIAKAMCAAARTAPKTKGIDNIVTLVLTDEDVKELGEKMCEVGAGSFLERDGGNVLKSDAVVLIGVKRAYNGLNCGYCGYPTCAACEEGSGECAFSTIDLGIAVGSAVSAAADNRADNRVMYSVGKVYSMMHPDDEHIIWLGIPVSVSGKSPYFDRKKKQ